VGSTIGVGITGIAGPAAAAKKKPVGLVHLALASASGVKERVARFPGDREMVRLQASQAALDMVRMHSLHGWRSEAERCGSLSRWIFLKRACGNRMLIGELKPLDDSWKWVRAANLHVTLKFLGEVAPDKLAKIVEALRTAPNAWSRGAEISGLGFFQTNAGRGCSGLGWMRRKVLLD